MSTCFECGEPAAHQHHVIPRSKGGTKTVPLCERCHGLVHNQDFTDHRELVRVGLERARRNGKKLGRPALKRAVQARILALRNDGLSMQAIADQIGVSSATVHRLITRA